MAYEPQGSACLSLLGAEIITMDYYVQYMDAGSKLRFP